MNMLNKQRLLENSIYLVLWFIVFALPYFTHRFTGDSYIPWDKIFRIWTVMLPFFIIFVIHNYWAAPYLLAKKYWKYFLIIIPSMIIILSVWPLIFPDSRRPHLPPNPMERNRVSQNNDTDWNSSSELRDFPPPKGDRLIPDFPPNGFFAPPHLEAFFIHFLIAILLIGFNMAVKLSFTAMKNEENYRELEKNHLQSELEYLKMQINPHFFMNMLNNIHALVDIDSEKAKITILEFSKLMRYILYDASQKTIELNKEINFTNNYIALMKMRYTENVQIDVSIPEIVPETRVPPLLFTSFIENAFKHGISYRNPSFVKIVFSLYDDIISFQIINSVHSRNQDSQGGIGISNTCKRLNLIYGNNYTLKIIPGETEYKLTLTIPFL